MEDIRADLLVCNEGTVITVKSAVRRSTELAVKSPFRCVVRIAVTCFSAS